MARPKFDPDKLEVIKDFGPISETDTSKIIAQIEKYDGGEEKLAIIFKWKYTSESDDAWKFSRKISLTQKQQFDFKEFFAKL